MDTTTRAHERTTKLPSHPAAWEVSSPPLAARWRSGLTILAARLIAGVAPADVARAFGPTIEELRIYRQHLDAVRQAHALAARGGVLRLELGGGIEGKPGWINADRRARDGLRLDLRRHLPFADESITEIYSEHFLTCLSYPHELMPLLHECHRVLVPGGKLTLGVADAGRAFRAYAAGAGVFYRDKYWANVRPQFIRAPMDELNWLIYMGGTHRHMFDARTLRMRLEEVGFSAVQQRPADPAIDDPGRAHQTIYLRASKPAGAGLDAEAIRRQHVQELLDELAGDQALVSVLKGSPVIERYALLRLATLMGGSAGRTLLIGPRAPALLRVLQRFCFPPAADSSATVCPEPPFAFADAHFRIIAALAAEHDERTEPLLSEVNRLLSSSRYARAYIVVAENAIIKLPAGLIALHRERLPAGAGTLLVLKHVR